MFRYIRCALISLAALVAAIGPALADEATMRLRGSDLTFTGTVLSFDGNSYKLETELFGTVTLDLRRFECISGACTATVTAATAAVGPDFGIHGSSTVGSKLMPKLIGAYAESIGAGAKGPADNDSEEAKIELVDSQGAKLASIDLITHGSDTAFSALAEGQVPLAMSSRPIKSSEAALLPSVSERILAFDGLLVIVSPQNPMSAISTDQLTSVFAGRIKDWSQLGLARGKINVYARNDGSGTLDTFTSLMLESAGGQLAPDAIRFRSDAELAEAVVQDPQGIGFTSFAYKGKAKPLDISTVCGITHSPSVFDVKAEEYPLSRHLFLYATSAAGAGHAKGILDYALSDRAQGVISGAGFVDQSLEYLAFKNQGDRIIRAFDTTSESFNLELAQLLIKEIGQLSRMSVTFRFRTASFTLDRQSQQKVERLAAALSSDQLRDKEILLMGFSDSVGAFDQNRELSIIRARQVKQELLRIGGGRIDGTRLKERGYGELLPVGCNEDPLGRAKNRRVEVWLKAPLAISTETSSSAKPSAETSTSTTPAPNENVSVEPSGTNNAYPPDLTEEGKSQLFRDFLQWRNNQSN